MLRPFHKDYRSTVLRPAHHHGRAFLFVLFCSHPPDASGEGCATSIGPGRLSLQVGHATTSADWLAGEGGQRR